LRCQGGAIADGVGSQREAMADAFPEIPHRLAVASIRSMVVALIRVVYSTLQMLGH